MADFVNSRVHIPGSQEYGILRYVGPIEGKSGVFCGLELTGTVAAIRGKNSGDVNGVQYFNVASMGSGLFVPYERLLSCNPQFEKSSTRADSPDASLIRAPKLRQHTTRKVSPAFTSPKEKTSTMPRSAVSSRTSSATSSRQVSGSSGTSLNLRQDETYLRRQLNEMQMAHSQEIAAKTAILDELQRTLAEAQPILDEYEASIKERDQKIARQKAEFDQRREEWRASTHILVTTHRENEAYFEEKLHALQEEVDRLQRQSLSGSNEAAYQTLQKQIEEMKRESINKDKQYSVIIETKDAEIHRLEKAFNLLKQEKRIVDSSEDDCALKLRCEDLEKCVAELEAEIVKKDQQLEKLTAINLASEVEAVSISGSRDNSYENKIQELEHELKMRPTIAELISIEESLDQLNQSHQESLDLKTNEIEALKATISSLEVQLKKASTQILAPDNKKHDSPKGAASSVTNEEGSLPIYQPSVKVDPGFGKDLWCGLCEREGHPSISCPYEQDIF